MNEEQFGSLVDELTNKLQEICNKFKENTGTDILIGYGIQKENSDIILEGATSSKDLDWNTACKMLIGINGFVSDYYGNLKEDNK